MEAFNRSLLTRELSDDLNVKLRGQQSEAE